MVQIISNQILNENLTEMCGIGSYGEAQELFTRFQKNNGMYNDKFVK